MESKTIFVTGATGNQGGATARSLLKKGFAVIALTRNTTSTRANELRQLGATIVSGDMNDTATFRDHLRGVHGIFCVAVMTKPTAVEPKQGIAMADLAKEYAVPHFVYSSGSGADLKSGIPHFETKLLVEDHIKHLGLPYTIIRPTSLYENFLIPDVKSRILKGKLVSPLRKNVIQQYIGSADIGEFAADVFTDKEKYLGKTITIAAEQMDMESVAAVFSKAMGRKIQYQRLPALITRLVMGKNLYKMFSWVNKHNAIHIKDLNAFTNEHPNLTSLEQWVRQHFKAN